MLVHFEGYSRSDPGGPELDFRKISVWGLKKNSYGATDIPKTTQGISLHHSLRVWAALHSKNSKFYFLDICVFGFGQIREMDGLDNPYPHCSTGICLSV